MLVLAMLLTVMGGGFSGIEVTDVPAGQGQLSLDISVRLTGSEGPVIGHFVAPGGDEERVSFASRGSGRWSATAKLRKLNWVLVLEDVGRGDLSEGVDMVALGILEPGEAQLPGDEPASADPPWGWLAIASLFGAMSLVVVAWSRRERSPRHLAR